MFIRSSVLGLSLAACLTLAHANAPADQLPTVDALTAGFAFDMYAGSVPVGDGRVNIDNTLFFINENSSGNLKSFYFFFDPSDQETVDATLTFGSSISSLITDKAGLDSTNSVYGLSTITYDTSTYIGLEPGQDSATFSGNTLTLHLSSSQPGDSLRVLVDIAPIPEPSAYVLLALGLVGLMFAKSGRTRNQGL